LIAALCLAVSAGGGLTAAADDTPDVQLETVQVVRWGAAWLKTYDEDGNYREGVPASALPPLPARIRRIDLEHRRIAIEITLPGRSPVLRYVDLSAATLSSPVPFVRPSTDSPREDPACRSGNCATFGILGANSPAPAAAALAGDAQPRQVAAVDIPGPSSAIQAPPSAAEGPPSRVAIATPAPPPPPADQMQLLATQQPATQAPAIYQPSQQRLAYAATSRNTTCVDDRSADDAGGLTGFPQGSSQFTDALVRALSGVAPALQVDANSGTRFLISGHADATGPGSLNSELSLRRAEMVRAFLVERGVPADSLALAGFGASDPLISTSGNANDACNRRVEIVALPSRGTQSLASQTDLARGVIGNSASTSLGSNRWPTASGAGVTGSPSFPGITTPATRNPVMTENDAMRASIIIGSSVFNDRNERIGSIDDIVIGTDKTLSAALSVGGFLGMGSKMVEIPFDKLRFGNTNNRVVTIPGMTKDALSSLPATVDNVTAPTPSTAATGRTAAGVR